MSQPEEDSVNSDEDNYSEESIESINSDTLNDEGDIESSMMQQKSYGDINSDDDSDDDSDDSDEIDMQKLLNHQQEDYLQKMHNELLQYNYNEVKNLLPLVKNDKGIIVDELHRTIPILTKYEKTRVLGARAKQLNNGSEPFIKVPESIIDGYLIAEMELEQKKIPFIIKRPLPNGSCEFWHLRDLENIII